jgi:MFS family permease
MVWGAGAVSDIGTWVQLIIVGSLIARTTGSALLTGLVAMATFTPQGIFSPIGGMLADRIDRRRIFGLALAGQALATTQC